MDRRKIPKKCCRAAVVYRNGQAPCLDSFAEMTKIPKFWLAHFPFPTAAGIRGLPASNAAEQRVGLRPARPDYCASRPSECLDSIGQERMDHRAAFRVAAVSQHLAPSRRARDLELPRLESLSLTSCASTYNNSYGRVHGQVSSQPVVWETVTLPGPELQEVVYEKAQGEGIVKITINRPERRNAFTPLTVAELERSFAAARDDTKVGVVILTGKGTEAFCSGGDQAVRGKHGYEGLGANGRLNVLDLQVQMKRLPKPIIAMVAGYAVGGGHILHMVSDLTIAADNAVFGQTGPKVGSFDAGYGCTMMARLVGQKKAREMWFLARFYDAQEAKEMGLVNTVVPLAELERETVKWCREILRNSPTAIRVCKAALNAAEDGHAGLQELAGNATLLFYGSEEGQEGRNAYMEGRKPDFSRFPWLP